VHISVTFIPDRWFVFVDYTNNYSDGDIFSRHSLHWSKVLNASRISSFKSDTVSLYIYIPTSLIYLVIFGLWSSKRITGYYIDIKMFAGNYVYVHELFFFFKGNKYKFNTLHHNNMSPHYWYITRGILNYIPMIEHSTHDMRNIIILPAHYCVLTPANTHSRAHLLNHINRPPDNGQYYYIIIIRESNRYRNLIAI